VTDWAGIDDPQPARRRQSISAPVTLRRRLPRPDPYPVLSSVDGGARLFQRNARTLLVGSALFIVPIVALNVVAASLAYDRFDTFDGAVISLPELIGGAAATTGVESLILFLGIYLTGLAVALCGGLAAEVVSRHRLGMGVELGVVLRATGRRIPALAVAWFVGHLWMLIASPVLVLASTEVAAWAGLLVSPLLLVLVAFTLFVSPVVMVERVGPFAALARSYRLSRLRFGTTVGLAVSSALVGLWIRFGITWLPRLLEEVELVEFGRFGWLVEGIAGQLGMLLAVPVVAAATAWAYLEVRLAAEGLDLAMEAEAVFGRTDG
jgi:hypothetical protein